MRVIYWLVEKPVGIRRRTLHYGGGGGGGEEEEQVLELIKDAAQKSGTL
jgi:hypothetical protein